MRRGGGFGNQRGAEGRAAIARRRAKTMTTSNCDNNDNDDGGDAGGDRGLGGFRGGYSGVRTHGGGPADQGGLQRLIAMQ